MRDLISTTIAGIYRRFFAQASIRLKLFCAMLALIVVVIFVMGATGRYIFNRDFLGYLNEQTQQQMEELVPRIEQAYRANGNWDFISDNPRAWFQLLKPVIVEREGLDVANIGPDGMPLSKALSKPAPTAADLTGATLRISLLDAQRKLVIGYPYIGSHARMRPIMRDSEIVGWIVQTPFENVISAIDLRFQHSQLLAQLIIGVAAIMLVGLIVIRISGVLLKPLVRVAGATHKLAGGDYAIRVEVETADEVGQLARDFNQLAMTLERNEKLRREFMADVSHELRTPLGILNGQLEALEDGILQPDEATVRSIKSEVTHLSKLVNDLYDLSLADAGALTYRKTDIDLAQLLRTTMQSYEDMYRRHGLTLQAQPFPDAMPIHADAGRLQQLFNNLFENSLRYTDANDGSGKLVVSCREEQQYWIVQFDDSAPGADAAVLSCLFERFYRADASRNRASGGAGLGLAICRRIVEAHQGEIRAETSPLGGLRLIVRLPVGTVPITKGAAA
ncbi:ATP-binding protein [Collimonas sp. NPDC087041]|uniref:ATP-binding protein n=1 Tax=Collimonas sp. NPDC087041 TaxID=3363960 RepID=UPI003800C4FE